MLKNLSDIIEGRKILFAFNDPAGAKQVLAFAHLNQDCYKSAVFASSRSHSFFSDFSFEVQDYVKYKPIEWIIKNKIDLLITGTSVPNGVETSLIAAAKSLGVQSISFIDHWINFSARFLVDNCLELPNMICVIDEKAKKLAVKDGLPENIISTVGNPYYEWLNKWTPNISRDKFLSQSGFGAKSHYILYAPEPLSNLGVNNKYKFTEIDGLNLIVDALKLGDHLSRNLLIKGHPNQDDQIFIDFLSDNSFKNVIYSREVDINEAIYYSDCVLGFFSNSLIEANIIGKTVYRLLHHLPTGVEDPLKDKVLKNFYAIHNNQELKQKLKDLIGKI